MSVSVSFHVRRLVCENMCKYVLNRITANLTKYVPSTVRKPSTVCKETQRMK